MSVGNLSIQVTEDDLQNLFAEYGEVTNVNIVTDRFSNQSKGFGFVEMPNNSQADKAIKALNGQELKGQDIKISQADNRSRNKKRSSRRRGY